MQNLASFSTSLDLEPPTFENAARDLNSETNIDDCPVLTKFSAVSPRTSENRPGKCLTP